MVRVENNNNNKKDPALWEIYLTKIKKMLYKIRRLYRYTHSVVIMFNCISILYTLALWNITVIHCCLILVNSKG